MFNFGLFDLKYVKLETRLIKQQMKTVVMVDQKPEEVRSKTLVPPSNVANNQWVQNVWQDRSIQEKKQMEKKEQDAKSESMRPDAIRLLPPYP